MFDIGFSELLLTAVVALLVLGPERLPRAARLAGLWMRRARASWYGLRAQLERELADDELRRSLQNTRDELRGLQQQLGQPVDVPQAATGSSSAPAAAEPSAAAPSEAAPSEAAPSDPAAVPPSADPAEAPVARDPQSPP